MSPLTTHVLDTALGRPARGLAITLDRQEHGGWRRIAAGSTNADGRVADLLEPGELPAGVYRITFVTGPYLEATAGSAFYPEAAVVFRVDAPAEHYHIPLLLSPFGYSTYRGS